jgi:hypothetical protein
LEQLLLQGRPGSRGRSRTPEAARGSQVRMWALAVPGMLLFVSFCCFRCCLTMGLCGKVARGRSRTPGAARGSQVRVRAWHIVCLNGAVDLKQLLLQGRPGSRGRSRTPEAARGSQVGVCL